jgi:hypothetical protein
MLGPPCGDVAGRIAIRERGKVRLRAVARIGGGLLRLGAQVGLDPVEKGRELILVTRALRQRVRDDDLRFSIDGGLGVVALDEAVLAVEDAALRLGEVALRLVAGRDLENDAEPHHQGLRAFSSTVPEVRLV